MNNPMKRAIAMACAALLVVLLAYFIPGVKDSKFGDFLKGGSIGVVSGAALMFVIAVNRQQKPVDNEK